MNIRYIVGAVCAGPYYLGPLASLVVGPPRPNLRDYKPLPEDRAQLVSIVLPARDEAENIERCVRSILSTQYPLFELIVVDDRSSDGTGDIVAKIAAADPRVRLVRGAEVPENWYGKPWACWQGYRETKGTLLLFTDADTGHGPQLLSRAVAAMERTRADMVTVMPLQIMLGFWERVVQPFFFLLLGLRFGTPARINRNRAPRNAIANGQFILATREAYEWVGGHYKVADTVIEDLMLAKRFVSSGRRIHFAVADKDMTTRMYTGLSQIVEGWSKNFFMGVLETTGSKIFAYAAALAALLLPALFLVPTAALAVGWPMWDHREGLGYVLMGFGAAGYLGASALIGTILHSARAPVVFGLLHPLGALMQAVVFLRAVLRGTRKITWKGRTYSH